MRRPYELEHLKIMYHDSLERIVLNLQEALAEIEEAVKLAQLEMPECEGWSDEWCPTSCEWRRVCERFR